MGSSRYLTIAEGIELAVGGKVVDCCHCLADLLRGSQEMVERRGYDSVYHH